MIFVSPIFLGIVVPLIILVVVLFATGRVRFCKHEYEAHPYGFNYHFMRYECRKCHKEVYTNRDETPPRGFVGEKQNNAG